MGFNFILFDFSFEYCFQMGYPVIRALEHFVEHNLMMQLTRDGYDLSNDDLKEKDDHLKISVATNSNVSWSKTFEYQLPYQRSKLQYFIFHFASFPYFYYIDQLISQ